MYVIVKCRCPDWFEDGDHALIEVTEDLILTLDQRIAAAKRAYSDQFYGMKWWDYTPEFTTISPDLIGPDGMDEQEYDRILDANSFVEFSDYDPDKCDLSFSRMSPCTMTVCVRVLPPESGNNNDRLHGSFYWTGTEKHGGDRVETYELDETIVDEWAELLGLTEKLRQVRRLRGWGLKR